MSESKHTRGPWIADDGEGCSVWNVWAPFRALIAKVVGDDAETEANARLIAASPRMLDALKVVMQHGRIDNSKERMNMVASAIAAAEGRS